MERIVLFVFASFVIAGIFLVAHMYIIGMGVVHAIP